MIKGDSSKSQILMADITSKPDIVRQAIASGKIQLKPSTIARVRKAGIVKGKALFLLPGSPDAVATAVSKLIVRELGHVLSMARQQKS